MTQEEARALQLGNQVKWIGDIGYKESADASDGHIGTVSEVSGAHINISWDDGLTTLFFFTHKMELKNIERVA